MVREQSAILAGTSTKTGWLREGRLEGKGVPLDHGFFFASFLSFLELFFFSLCMTEMAFADFRHTHTPHHSARTRLHLVFIAVAGVHKGMETTNWWWLGAFFLLLLRPSGIPYSTTQALTLLGGYD
jgi:hypothetical protein